MHSLCRCLCLLSSWLCLHHSMRNLGLLRTHFLLSAVRWHLSSRLPLVCRLVVVSHVVACLCCVNFCLAAASSIHPEPLFFVRASRLSRHTSPHHLHLLTCCHLTTGCVVAITNVRMSLLSLRRHLCHHHDCDCHPCRLLLMLSSWRHRSHCCRCC